MNKSSSQLHLSRSFTIHGGQIKVGDRKAGYIKCLKNGELAFITPRKRNQHYFRNYRGYGINSDLIQYLREHKVNSILIIEDSKRLLLSETEDWMFSGFEYNHRHYEPQLILSEDNMTVKKGLL